uniref:Ig-like domain-containing protein n=1 Tax=Astyanax mexicanus TaxID=7994 RepID=A0A3B1JPL0_ASTMX
MWADPHWPFRVKINLIGLFSLGLPTAALTVESRWSPLFTGESVTLKCEITGYDGWRYQWYKGSSRTAVSESQINTFNISSAKDQDQYWCKGTRKDRPTSSQDSNKVTLTVKAVASITNNQVFVGENVTLMCFILGGVASDWQYSWFKKESSTPVIEKPTYRISPVKKLDSGEYTCRGKETSTSRYSNPSFAVTLTVSGEYLPTATLTVDPASTVFTGESVTLKCEITGYDGWRYQWYKGSSRITTSTDKKRTFTISSAADQDQYWCRGERDNRPRSSQNSDKVTLTVRGKFTDFIFW